MLVSFSLLHIIVLLLVLVILLLLLFAFEFLFIFKRFENKFSILLLFDELCDFKYLLFDLLVVEELSWLFDVIDSFKELLVLTNSINEECIFILLLFKRDELDVDEDKMSRCFCFSSFLYKVDESKNRSFCSSLILADE
jgi:hypothetical protein